MKTPIGVTLKIGQKWKEVDHRLDRVVTITAIDEKTRKVQLNGKTMAKVERFHGKRNGYAPYEQ